MYRQSDTLSAVQKSELKDRITKIRELIVMLRDGFEHEPKDVTTSQSIVGHASILWEMLTELNSRGLHGYGRVPDALARYLDPVGERLTEEMNGIAGLFSQ